MATVLTTILNMSLTASIVILVVLLARLCLRKVPKIYSYLLWSVVLFRLLCPISFSLPVSLLAPFAEVSTASDAGSAASMEYISLPDTYGDQSLPEFLPDEQAGANSTVEADAFAVPDITETSNNTSASKIALTILWWIWAAGVAGVLGVTVWQTINLRRKLADACVVRGNIFESDSIDTAFVLGVLTRGFICRLVYLLIYRKRSLPTSRLISAEETTS